MRIEQRLITRLTSLLVACMLPAYSYANTINLHDAPNDQSKISGTVDLSAGIIPIFTPKGSQWIKVADPRNGNTGWVKNSDIKDSKGNIISFSQKISEDGNSAQSMQIMQYGSQNVTPEQKKKYELQIQQQEKAAQESFLKVQQGFSQILIELKKAYQQQSEIMQKGGFPILLPIFTPPTQQNISTPQPVNKSTIPTAKPAEQN